MNIEMKDIQTLQNVTSGGDRYTSPNGVNGIKNFYYFFPKSEKDISLIQSLLQKYGIQSQRYISSVSPVPVVRVPLVPWEDGKRMPPLNELLDLFEHQAKPANNRPNAEPPAPQKPILHKMEQADIKALAGMLKQAVPATSPNAENGTTSFIYFMPKGPGKQDAIAAILNKYELQALPHMTGLNNRAFPILRVPVTDNTHDFLAHVADSVNTAIALQELAYRGQLNAGKQQVHKKNMWQQIKDILNINNQKQ